MRIAPGAAAAAAVFALLAGLAAAGPAQGPGVPRPGVNLIWTHSATELEDLARAALPLRFDIGGQWTGQKLVVEDVGDLRTESGRARVHVRGKIHPLGVPLDAEPVLTLRFDALRGEHVVALQSLTLTLGALGKVDLSRLLGPWVVRPEQAFVVPVRGGEGIGMQVTVRRLDLSAAGLRAEADVRYFPPPPPAARQAGGT